MNAPAFGPVLACLREAEREEADAAEREERIVTDAIDAAEPFVSPAVERIAAQIRGIYGPGPQDVMALMAAVRRAARTNTQTARTANELGCLICSLTDQIAMAGIENGDEPDDCRSER